MPNWLTRAATVSVSVAVFCRSPGTGHQLSLPPARRNSASGDSGCPELDHLRATIRPWTKQFHAPYSAFRANSVPAEPACQSRSVIAATGPTPLSATCPASLHAARDVSAVLSAGRPARVARHQGCCRDHRSVTRALVIPTESPQVGVRGGDPHRKPTDGTALPGTRRHGC